MKNLKHNFIFVVLKKVKTAHCRLVVGQFPTDVHVFVKGDMSVVAILGYSW